MGDRAAVQPSRRWPGGAKGRQNDGKCNPPGDRPVVNLRQPPTELIFVREFGCGCAAMLSCYEDGIIEGAAPIVIELEYQERCNPHADRTNLAMLRSGAIFKATRIKTLENGETVHRARLVPILITGSESGTQPQGIQRALI